MLGFRPSHMMPLVIGLSLMVQEGMCRWISVASRCVLYNAGEREAVEERWRRMPATRQGHGKIVISSKESCGKLRQTASIGFNIQCWVLEFQSILVGIFFHCMLRKVLFCCFLVRCAKFLGLQPRHLRGGDAYYLVCLSETEWCTVAWYRLIGLQWSNWENWKWVFAKFDCRYQFRLIVFWLEAPYFY